MKSPVSPSGGSRTVDLHMERAKALKYEKQIFMSEVKHLIGKLDASLQHAQSAKKRRLIPRSAYSSSEVTRTVDALRSVLFAAEVVRSTRENPSVPAALRQQARVQLLNAVNQL